ncbi:MAG TPA: hypothetical protein H9829_00515 [Candidatus Tetragenococcus pullicola]|nr:hypothetical protein [Candidatus Tetragenococcus pullicola]
MTIENFTWAMQMLALGWGGVFLVLLIIYLAAKLLTKIFPTSKKGERGA